MRLTASKFALAHECRYWAREDVEAPKVEPASTAASVGTALHSILEAHFRALGKGQPSPGMRAAPATLSATGRRMIAESLVHFMEHRISKIAWVPEQAFAYDPATDIARVLPTAGHRDYSQLQPGELAGTPDAYFHEAKTRTVFVPDWKTGEGNESYRQSAKFQSDFNALLVARAFNATTAHVFALRLSPDGLGAEPRQLNADDLDRIAADVRAVVKAIPDAEPQPGPHCVEGYCPLRGTCPATLRWQAALVPLRVGSGELSFTPTTAQHFALSIQAEAALRSMADWLKAGREAAVNALPGESVELPDGRRYERREKIVRSIDLTAPGASDFLRESGVGDAILEEVTLGRLEAALRAEGYRGGEVDRYMDTLLAGLDSLGALIGAPTTSYEVTGKRALVATPREIDRAGERGVDGYPLLRI